MLLVLDNFEQVLDAADLVEGTDQRATAELHQARREAQQAGDRRLEAWAVWGLSDIGVAMGDWDLAARIFGPARLPVTDDTFVGAGVTQTYTFVTRVPYDCRFLLVWAGA